MGGEPSQSRKDRLAPASSPRGERGPWLATGATVFLLGVTHLLVAARLGFGVDEAHYALYGFHLDWSYFDHPPMVGWLQALALQVSDRVFALRLISILLGAITLLLTHVFARRLFPRESPWTAFAAVLLLASAVLCHLIFVTAVPETPLIVFSLAAMIVLLHLLDRPSLPAWLLLGLFLGLAGLSKYTAILLVLTVVGMILLSGRRRLFATPGPWLAAAVAALVVSPVFVWNAQNDWVSFRYQLGHGTRGDGWSLKQAFIAQAAQLGCYGPGLIGFSAIALVAGWRERANRGVLLTLLLVLPLLALFAWASGYRMTLPHWTALGWVGAAPLAARWIFHAWTRRPVRIAVWTVGLLSVLAVGTVLSHALFLWLPLPGANEPLADMIGWRAAARRGGELRESMVVEGQRAPRLFTDNWSRASRIAWYARPMPVVVVDERLDQFDRWFGAPDLGDRGVLVTWSRRENARAPSDLARFDHTAFLEQMPVMVGQRRVGTFRFFACEGFRPGPPR